MTYGAECLPIKKQHMQKKKKKNAEVMRNSRWICDQTRKNKIRKECIWKHLQIEYAIN